MPPRLNSDLDPRLYIKMEPGMLCGENSSYINYSKVRETNMNFNNICCDYDSGFKSTSPEMERYYMALDRLKKDNEDNLNEVTSVFTYAIKEKLTEYAQENCVKKIIRNGPATIVFWDDGTKTIVKRANGTKDDIYMAFCSAFAKKMLGSNSRIQRIIKKNLVDENN